MPSFNPYNNPDLPLFHNTIGLKGEELRKRELKAQGCAAKVLEYFANAPRGVTFTAAQVWISLGQRWPLTSIRRSMSDLKKMGYLEMLDEKRPGIYNELNHTWQLKR